MSNEELRMQARAMFPAAGRGEGMYESFYLRAVAPDEPVGAWIRYTVHKRPGEEALGSLWCTIFDARKGGPFMHKVTLASPMAAGNGDWIAIGDARLGPEEATGSCGEARWSLGLQARAQELRHLTGGWMYRGRLPRTKPTSPSPDVRFSGTIELGDRPALRLDGWRGMVGHNWGAEHAERWIWLHGIDFEGEERAWLDVAIGRIVVGGRLTPWVANGAVSLRGRRIRLGGLLRRGVRVRESAAGCEVQLPGAGGAKVIARLRVPAESAAGWRYADPDGSEHEVVNCSVAAVELEVSPGDGTPTRTLSSDHGGVYELGMRPVEAHGVALAPFADG
ncbi:MAG TPA: hypothetical protein VL972_05705 [Solirubrobacteraceae bacterium]|nr:hypothetical protein [Solirubrobacteraceae bacterium]